MVKVITLDNDYPLSINVFTNILVIRSAMMMVKMIWVRYVLTVTILISGRNAGGGARKGWDALETAFFLSLSS